MKASEAREITDCARMSLELIYSKIKKAAEKGKCQIKLGWDDLSRAALKDLQDNGYSSDYRYRRFSRGRIIIIEW